MNILYETESLLIEYEFEVAFLIDKKAGQTLVEEEFYGDPTCGLIDENNKWAVIAGEKLIIWTPKETKEIEDKDLKWVHALRTKDNHTIEILVDPWSDKSSIWELDTNTFEYKKIKDFSDYCYKEYTEDINW